jgi:hypothetical protein
MPPETQASGGDARSLSTSQSLPFRCDICGGTGKELIENRLASYAGSDSTCGELSNSLQLKREFSFTCSLARTSLTNSCCADSCQMCPNGREVDADAMVEHEGKLISCADYELTLSGLFTGSEECNLASSISHICCLAEAKIAEAPQLVQAPSSTPCGICHRDNVHHELKSEAMVGYKGTSISCLDLNSVLAKNEAEGSEICSATQSMLFNGCCYEKCSLCGEKSLRWGSTVTYNSQILSCDELVSMFTLGAVWEGSEQCDAMQSAYSSACCFKPPQEKCNLCNHSSSAHGVNTHAFVKTLSSSVHCVDLANGLAEREEEGSETCANSRLEYSGKCCTSSAMPSLPDTDASYYDWLTDHMAPSSSNISRLSVFFWLSMIAILLFI